MNILGECSAFLASGASPPSLDGLIGKFQWAHKIRTHVQHYSMWIAPITCKIQPVGI